MAQPEGGCPRTGQFSGSLQKHECCWEPLSSLAGACGSSSPHLGPLPTTHPPQETSSAHFTSQTAFIGHLALYCTQEGGGCHLEQGPSVGGAANDAT